MNTPINHSIKTEITPMPAENAVRGSNVINISDDSGRYTMTVYQLFDGISFVYSDAHVQSVDMKERLAAGDNMFEISHCREGRVECDIHGRFTYMSPGDLVIARSNSVSAASYFPLGHYHGVTVIVDLDAAPMSLAGIMPGVNVSPAALAEKFCGGEDAFIARSDPFFEHIFAELYSVPEDMRAGYLRLKTLELLLFLDRMELQAAPLAERSFTKAQTELAKAVSDYLLRHTDEHVTLHRLTERFHLSGTYIKKIFKDIYGVPIGEYNRTRKMESAAYMLEYTDKSVLEIANLHGYDNGSKFAGAFRAVKGVTPTVYRNSVSRAKNSGV